MFNSVYFIVMAGGVHRTWAIFCQFQRELLQNFPQTDPKRNLINYGWNDLYDNNGVFYHSIISYYIGIIIGSIFATALIHKVQKKKFYILSSVVLIVSGGLSCGFYQNYEVFIACRYLAGIAIGLAFIPFIFHTSEISGDNVRGSRLGGLSMMMMAGVLLMSGLINGAFNQKGLNVLCGTFSIVYGVIGIVIALVFGTDSPIFYLAKGQTEPAIISLLILRKECEITDHIREEFDELNAILEEDKDLSSCILSDGNYKPLICTALLRMIFTLSLCLPLTHFLAITITDQDVITTTFSTTIIALIRFSTELTAFFLMDSIPRRILLLISTTLSGIMLIVIGAIYATSGVTNSTIRTFSCIYPGAVGFGLGSVSLAYLGEVFPRKKKAFSLLTIVIIDIATEIISASLIAYGSPPYLDKEVPLVIGVVILIFGGLLYFVMPETKKLSMRECYNKMR